MKLELSHYSPSYNYGNGINTSHSIRFVAWSEIAGRQHFMWWEYGVGVRAVKVQ